MEIETAVLALAALAQDTRLAVYRALVQAGPEGLAAGRIAESLAVPAATLSFHLKELGNAGLIGWRQSGRFVIYSANYSAMNALLGFLTEHCCAGKRACAPPRCEAATAAPRPRRSTAKATQPARARRARP